MARETCRRGHSRAEHGRLKPDGKAYQCIKCQRLTHMANHRGLKPEDIMDLDGENTPDEYGKTYYHWQSWPVA